jgi:osmotically-inducible protein OsmY
MLMFGCLFRFIKVILVLAVLALLGGGLYYYTKVHPERAPWKGGMAAVQDKVGTAKLAAEVKTALALRESLNGLDVSVSAEKAVVTVRGKVPSAEVAKTVENVAQSVPGVRQVVSFLEVDPSAGRSSGSDDRTVGERVDDEALELKIRAAFRLDRNLEGPTFEVTSRRRVVQIASANASADQKKRAGEVAKSVEGVVSVDVR